MEISWILYNLKPVFHDFFTAKNACEVPVPNQYVYESLDGSLLIYRREDLNSIVEM